MSEQAKPADALLVIEVADTTLRYDRRVKVPLYAAAGVAEVWIVDMRGRQVLVFRSPRGRSYRVRAVRKPGQQLAATLLPNLRIRVEEILP